MGDVNANPRPRRRRKAAAEYLRDFHNLPVTEKTLANRNAAGLGPKPDYFGTIPFYRQEVLDAFAESAFTPESPVAVTRRRNAAVREREKTDTTA